MAHLRLLLILIAAVVAAGSHWPAAAASRQHQAAGTASAPADAAQLRASDADLAGFFDAYMSAAMERLDMPGGAIVVVRDGRTILAKGYGHADLGSCQTVEVEESLFRAASISKIIPWLLAMQLVEEGRLDLDADVNRYLDFEIPAAFGQPITTRHLMTHSAGFPERFHGVFDPDLSTPLGRKLRENIPERIYPPGSTIAYSNYGAALAGYIVQRLRGQTWEQLVAERIFAPVGMRRSTVLQPVPAEMRRALVSTYAWGSSEPAPFRTTPLAPMGALTASAGDMGRLLAMIAAEGQGQEGRIVAAETMRRMLALELPLGPGLPDGFGLGFLVGEYRGIRYAGHAGNMSTLATDLEILPDHGLGWYYVFSSQGAYEGARRIRDDLLEAVIEEYLVPQALPVRTRGASSARDLAGSWVSTRRIFSGPLMFSGLMNTTDVRANGDGSLTVESGGVVTHWLPDGRDRFRERESGVALTVVRGAGGRAERIASAALYPAAVFERPPLHARWVPPVAVFAFGTFLLALIVRPISWLVRRRHRRRARASGPAETGAAVVDRDARVRQWARIAFWAMVATLFGWAAFALALAFDFGLIFTAPAIVRVGLGLMTLSSAPLAAIVLADALLAWRDPSRNWPSRIAGLVLAVAAIGLAWLYYTLDVINFSTDW